MMTRLNSQPKLTTISIAFTAAWMLLTANLSAAETAAPKPEAKKEAAANAKLPSAREIVDRFVKAIGGREAFLKHDCQRIKGSYELPAQGIKAPLDVSAQKPNRVLIKVSIPGFGDVLTGYDGSVGWSINAATGPMLTEGKSLEQLKEQSDFGSILHDDSNYKSAEVLEQTQFEGKSCHKVRFTRNSGSVSTEFFEVDSGLLVGLIADQESPMGRMEVTSVVGAYKKFDGALYATRTVQKMGAFEQIITVDSMDFGKLPASIFDLPDAIKALKQPAPATEEKAKPAAN